MDVPRIIVFIFLLYHVKQIADFYNIYLLLETRKNGDHSKYLDVNGRIGNKVGGCGLDSSCSAQRQSTFSYEYDNECGEFFIV